MDPDRANGDRTGRHPLRYLGAVLLLGVAAVHLQQYYGAHYRVIPVIGLLFAANIAGAALLGIALLCPLERMTRTGRVLPSVVAAGAVAFAAGTMSGLAVSESGTLFGFHENGYRLAIVLSIALEGAAIVALGGYLAAQRATLRPRSTWPSP